MRPGYPVTLRLEGRRCLVVGGGAVAARKIASLLEAGAAVTVVAPSVHVALGILRSQGAIDAIEGSPLDVQIRPYQPGEAAFYRLVVTATGSREVNKAVRDDAEAAGVWVNAADDPANCTFTLPAVYREGAVSLAVSTDGSSPALASWLRTRVATSEGGGLASLAELLGAGRQVVLSRGGSTEDVDWRSLLDGPLPALVRAGRLEEAARLVATAVDAATPGEDGSP